MSIWESLKRGTVDLLLLTLLHEEDMYGYQLSQELSNRSEGLYVMPEGSMYPTLYRMLEKGLISRPSGYRRQASRQSVLSSGTGRCRVS